jgi:hypothetical protein
MEREGRKPRRDPEWASREAPASHCGYCTLRLHYLAGARGPVCGEKIKKKKKKKKKKKNLKKKKNKKKKLK